MRQLWIEGTVLGRVLPIEFLDGEFCQFRYGTVLAGETDFDDAEFFEFLLFVERVERPLAERLEEIALRFSPAQTRQRQQRREAGFGLLFCQRAVLPLGDRLAFNR